MTKVMIVDKSTNGTSISSPNDVTDIFTKMELGQEYEVFAGTQLNLSPHTSILFAIDDNWHSTMGEITMKVNLIVKIAKIYF